MLASALAPLSGSMDAFAGDLANGTFRPFGDLGKGARSVAPDYSSNLGGFTGSSKGNYLPGQADPPVNWPLDRDGTAGAVTIDSVFNPDLGAMKRLKAYDRVGADGVTLQAGDPQLRPAERDPALSYDMLLLGSYPVQFRNNVPVAIFSPHPKAIIQSYSVDPPLRGGVSFYKDGADTFYANAHVDRIATLNVTFRVSRDYYLLDPAKGVRTSDYQYSTFLPRPVVPQTLVDDAKIVLARAGVSDPTDVGGTIDALATYFRSFTEGAIPTADDVPDLYLALALGEHGCCRHRAFAFMITAQSLGIPTRVVVNEAHAFVEVAMPDGRWHQINLGGCGTFTLNNPAHYPPLFPQATDPRHEADPEQGKPVPTIATRTQIADAPPRIVKGQSYLVNGTVTTLEGRGVANARVDIYLNATKTSVGKLTGAGTADGSGRFSIAARVPIDAPAQGYQLVARGSDGHASATVRFLASWSDPPVDVFTPTSFLFPIALTGAATFPVNVTARLVDAEGTGVANATLHWTAESVAQADLHTDAAGRAVGRLTFASQGARPIAFRFDGDAHHGPAEGTTNVSILPGAILMPPDPTLLVRGEPGSVDGTVALAGVPLSGRQVVVQLRTDTLSVPGPGPSFVLATANGTLAADGSFDISLVPPRSVRPGAYGLTVSVPSLALEARPLARVAARPNLTLDAPGSTTPDRALVVVATLASDDGTPIGGASLDLFLDGHRAQTTLTNASGGARFEIPGGTLRVGAHTLSASFAGDRDHVEAVQARAVRSALPWYASVPSWAYALAVLLALLVVAVLPTLPRLRRAAAAAGARVHRPARRFLAVAFVDHPPGVAPVFEAGETARVRIVARDKKGAAVAMRVGITAGASRLRARTRGEKGALFDIGLPQAGTVLLRAHATGVARLWTPPLERRVPVSSYRAAIENGFVELRERARLGRDATAGDVVAQMRPRVGTAAHADLERAARLFEVADFAQNACVDRAFYHAFARAVSRVNEEALDG